MAAVMYQAAQVEDTRSNEVAEKVARLEYENKHLRQLLQFSTPRDQLMAGFNSSSGDSPSRSRNQIDEGSSPKSVQGNDIIR